jgi:hypothetical protein
VWVRLDRQDQQVFARTLMHFFFFFFSLSLSLSHSQCNAATHLKLEARRSHAGPSATKGKRKVEARGKAPGRVVQTTQRSDRDYTSTSRSGLGSPPAGGRSRLICFNSASQTSRWRRL